MDRIAAALALGFATAISGCTPYAEPPVASAPAVEQREPVTILVSIDGFRPDYLDRGLTPTLSRLAAEGVRASMRPSFPSKTFPNHWTLVTGLVPDHHGIIANSMEDPDRPGENFTMATVDPWWWSDAKPIWVEAEEAGIRSAAMFWPGSAVPWGGTAVRYGPVTDGEMASDWQAFSMQVSNTQRVNAVLDWMRRPADIRPEFVTLYFDTIDSAGHGGGPEGKQIDAALRDIDHHIANLVAGLETLHQPANLVIVADHGMAATGSDKMVVLADIVDPSLYRLVEGGAYATFEPTEGNTAALEAALLRPHDHMECWRKSEIPARFQYGTHRRIPPYFCLPDTGWTIASTASDSSWSGGNHGYDPFAPEMAAVFIGNGPAFRRGATLASFQNTAITPLLRVLLDLPPAARSDGRSEDVAGALATQN